MRYIQEISKGFDQTRPFCRLPALLAFVVCVPQFS